MSTGTPNFPPDVVFATNRLGIGGTEKGMVAQAVAMDPRRARARVVGILGGGPRRASLEAAGLRVDVTDGDGALLTEALRGADVVIVVRRGIPEPMLPAAARHAGVPHLVEWSVFGHRDPSDDRHAFACHLFISKMIELRYRATIGDRSPTFHDRHRVHYLPVDPGLRQRAPERREAKKALGLDPLRPVVGRVGRAHDLKWRDLLVDMLPDLFRLEPEAQVVLMGTTPRRRRRLKRLGLLDRCMLIDPTTDEAQLATVYAACDVFVSAAQIGESQGLANLEAMSLGIPVVTCSTPWVDNAQVEFVEHEVTGLIANHPRPFAEAVALLLRDASLRERLGRAAATMIEGRFDPGLQARQLERLCTSLIERGRLPNSWDPSPDAVDAFAAEYERRQALELRSLTAREKLEAKLTRYREPARLLGDTVREHLGRV